MGPFFSWGVLSIYALTKNYITKFQIPHLKYFYGKQLRWGIATNLLFVDASSEPVVDKKLWTNEVDADTTVKHLPDAPLTAMFFINPDPFRSKIRKLWEARQRCLSYVEKVRSFRRRHGKWSTKHKLFFNNKSWKNPRTKFPGKDHGYLTIFSRERPKTTRLRHLVSRYNNFLAHYRRQLYVLAFRGRYFCSLRSYRIKKKQQSKRIWFAYKKYKKHRKWLKKKNFTIDQQYKYYKYNKFLPKRRRVFRTGTRPRWFIRKITRDYNLVRLAYRIDSILEKFSDNNAIYSSLKSSANKLIPRKSLYGGRRGGDLKLRYFCLSMRKKKNNYYLTLSDGAGNIKFFLSSGSFLLNYGEKKRNKKLRTSFRHFMEAFHFFANKLKQRRVFCIKYFFRPPGIRRKLLQLMLNALTERRITVINIIRKRMQKHRIKKKLKKIRRL